MNYSLADAMMLLDHGTGKHKLLRDRSEPKPEPNELHIRALVASGDYFELLASSLDQISRNLGNRDPNHYQLEYLTRSLMYLQRYYKIVKKSDAD